MTESIDTYTNYLGAEVINDCPGCDQSHFVTDVVLDENSNATIECPVTGEAVHIHNVGN